MSNKNLNYRPDIDGLRAFAVLFVVIFHLFPEYIKGGYIGVDIFFVISGYLITQIILKDLENDSFYYKKFYDRRIRRIFPLFLLVLIVSFIYTYFTLITSELNLISKQIFSASLFIANIRLSTIGGYFDLEANARPLMHMWSLSVEEQFYLLWPGALVLIHKLSKNIKHKINFMILSTIVSYIAYIFFNLNDSPKGFYWLHARLWELSFGGILAALSLKNSAISGKACLKQNIASVMFGLLLFAFAFIVGNDQTGYYFFSVIPVAATGYLIYQGKKDNIVSKILSYPILVYVGRLSYPLYLIHWPLISFIYIIDPHFLTAFVKISLLIVSFLLSWIVNRYYETPIRYCKSKYTSIVLLGFWVIVCLSSLYVYRMDVVSAPCRTYPIAKKISDASLGFIFPTESLKSFEFKNQTYQHIGPLENDIVLFYGDSNMEQYASRIDFLYRTKKYKMTSVFFTKKAACPIPNVEQIGSGKHVQFSRDFLEYAEKKNVKRIVISASWPKYFITHDQYHYVSQGKKLIVNNKKNHEIIFLEFENMLKTLKEKGKEVVLILPMPQAPDCSPKNLCMRNFWGFYRENLKYADKKNRYDSNDFIKKKLISIAEELNIKVVDPNPHFEIGNFYKTFDDCETFAYCDETHFTSKYMEKHADFIDCLIE